MEISIKTECAIDKLNKARIPYNLYPNGQINCMDKTGTIHSYWANNGTVLLHARDEGDRRTKTFRDQTIESFIKAMNRTDLNKLYFWEA